MRTSPLTRLVAAITAIAATALLLTACGGDDDTAADRAGEKVTVDAENGSFTLDYRPERIVVIGAAYVDMLAALGQQPVAFAGAGEADEAAFTSAAPWMKGVYTGEFDPSLITAEYKADAEAIALHNPDLIVGSPYYIGDQQYEQLTDIAPTYVLPFSADKDWRESMADFGKLTGTSDRVTEVVNEIDKKFADARASLPGLQGKTFNMAWYATETGLRFPPAYGWVNDLGLEHAANQPGVGKKAVNVSIENLDQLAADIAFVQSDGAAKKELESDPRFAELPASKNKSLFFVDRSTIDASILGAPAALSWLLEQIIPLLRESPLNSAGK